MDIGYVISYLIAIIIVALLIMPFLNVITIPLTIILIVVCACLKRKKPTLKRWLLLFYPSWNYLGGVKRPKQMTGRQYEYYCADLLRKNGYHDVSVTPGSGDFGADITAKDRQGQKWVFQCKFYKSKLGNKPVQEVVSAKVHYGASCAGVITNSELTNAARQLAKENDVLLYEHVD